MITASARSARQALKAGRRFSQNSLYRIFGAVVMLMASGAALTQILAPPMLAQEEKPEIVPQRSHPAPNAKARIGKEPRALGILQLNSSGKGSLIPVAILIDGHFYDAGAYKANPIPMALDSGIVYEAEQSGDSQGIFTIAGALHSKETGSTHHWVGTGTFLPKGTEVPKSGHKAEDVPIGINGGGDEPPRLTRKDSPKPAADAESAGPTAPAAEKPAGERPTEEKPAEKPAGSASAGKSGEQSAGNSSAPAAVPGKSDSKADSKPEAEKPASDSPAERPPAEPSSANQGANDEYRPTLRRGKPTEPIPEEKKEMAKKTAAGEAAKDASTPALSKDTSPIRVVAAISDAGGPEPQSYKYFWKPGEEDERRKQMTALAGDEVRGYAYALAKNHISASPLTAKGAANRKTAIKQAKPALENVQFAGYDMWLTNQPVLILTADARIPGWSENGESIEPYRVAIVARTDIYGDLKKLYSTVTDKFHLDVAPQMELIDVVDADGDGRGELFFRKTNDLASGYVIYRATADKLWKMFDSLSAK